MQPSPISAADLLDARPGFRVLCRHALTMARVAGMNNVRVWRLPPSLATYLDGRADVHGRIVWLADDAPLITVAHEIAHLVTPGHGHDSVWLDEVKRLAPLLL